MIQPIIINTYLKDPIGNRVIPAIIKIYQGNVSISFPILQHQESNIIPAVTVDFFNNDLKVLIEDEETAPKGEDNGKVLPFFMEVVK